MKNDGVVQDLVTITSADGSQVTDYSVNLHTNYDSTCTYIQSNSAYVRNITDFI